MHACGRAGTSLILIAFLAMTMAPPLAGAREHETVSRSLSDDRFIAGTDLIMTEEVPGDAILVGGRIATSGAIHGDEVAAGGQLELGADVDGGLYVAGGRVHLDGKVGRNARIAGADVEVGPQAEVQGGLTIGGGRVEFNGRVGKYLQIGARSARINGHVGGDLDVASAELDVGPNAVIDGQLTYYGPRAATIAAGAQIRGGVHYVERKPSPEHRRGFGAGAWIWLIGWFIAGSILLALFPGFARSASNSALQRTGLALLLGFAVLVCVPVAAILLIASVIGIPLALLLLASYLVLLPLGYLASAVAIGEWLLLRLRRGAEIFTRQRILMLLGVLVALFVLARVPVLGGILRFLVMLAGVGSLVMAGVARHRAQ